MELENHLDGIEARLRRYAERLEKRDDIGKRVKLVTMTADAVSAAAARIRMLEATVRRREYEMSPHAVSMAKAAETIQEEIDAGGKP